MKVPDMTPPIVMLTVDSRMASRLRRSGKKRFG